MPAKTRRAVFLDRDGTLLNERGYLGDPRNMRFFPSAFGAVASLRRGGFRIVVVTNQSGIGRGFFSERRYREVNRAFLRALRRRGAVVDAVYHCPHRPEAGCRCRKPSPFFLRRAAKRFGIDLRRSYVIGDQARDVRMARAAGATGVLVLTGAGRSARTKIPRGVKVSPNALSAARWILRTARENDKRAAAQ